jgi:hypothetical protein
MLNPQSDHYTRPKECPTKLLEKMEANGSITEEFQKELSRRRSNKRDLKALRAQRRENYMESIKEKVAHHNLYNGDSRKMYSKKG